jgi:hypothetical protein
MDKRYYPVNVWSYSMKDKERHVVRFAFTYSTREEAVYHGIEAAYKIGDQISLGVVEGELLPDCHQKAEQFVRNISGRSE